MVLAAGLGTRLRPLTESKPKALVEIGGRTLLEIVLARLRAFGIREVIVNVHHFADLVVDYLRANQDFGMRVEVSREDVLLDTGGGLKKAAWFFLEGKGTGDEPFLLHNVDVVSTIDFARMAELHRRAGALGTLAVQDRRTSRYLLFDESGELCGRRGREGKGQLVRHATPKQALAFCGVHVISTRLLSRIEQCGVFSIIDTYLSLAAKGERILAFRADEYYWRDLGKPEDLAQASRDFEQRIFA